MAKKAPSNISVIEAYNACNEDIKNYYSELISLLEDEKFSYETAISYCFLKLEQALHIILYGGLVKLHKVDTKLAQNKIQGIHLTRESFIILYKNIYSKKIPYVIQDKIKLAELTRDRVMHGKRVQNNDIREAIIDILEYSNDFMNEVKKQAKFNPFGNIKGYAGRYTPLNKQTTAWLLKGILEIEKKK